MFVNELHQGGINALLAYDYTIFDNMVLPSGISLNEVVDNIVLKYGNTPLMIPAPEIMKFYIGRWSNKRLAQWERFKRAVEMSYNPIENYNRSETRTENSNEDISYGHKIISNDDLTHGMTSEDQISADNAATYQADRKNIHSGIDQRNMDESHSGSDTLAKNNSITSNISGNIGVTTSQQMLLSELELIPKLNVIDYITEDFHNEFCLYVY